MPHRPIDGPPADHVDGAFLTGDPTTPEGAAAQHVAVRLNDAIAGRSLRSVAVDAGVHHTTISAILRGERWADFVTIVRLETGLGVSLWPGADRD